MSSPQNFIWIHENAMSVNHPVFKAAGGNAHAFFIWDKGYFEQNAYSLKRLTFLYETLIDMPITVYAGDTATTLRHLCENQDDNSILYVPETPDAYVLKVIDKIQLDISVQIIQDKPFIEVSDDVDMARFFRFWNRSRKSALGFEPSQ